MLEGGGRDGYGGWERGRSKKGGGGVGGGGRRVRVEAEVPGGKSTKQSS